MKYTVMLADDEPIMRKALQALVDWNSLECEVIYVAKNGEELLAQIKRTEPDILVTDIQMPGKTGIEIAKYIWENRLSTKVILLTAYADFSYAQSAIRYNVVEYVTKTGAFDGLLQAVENCKKMMLEERKNQSQEIKTVKAENFLKGVYDGIIYEDVSSKFAELGLYVRNYAILFFKFLMNDDLEKQKKTKIYTSLENFFHMAFNEKMVYGLFLQKDMYGVILECNEDSKDSENQMIQTGSEIMDMMDRFMELFTYVGISKIYQDVEELPRAFYEAGAALEYSYLSEKEKINCYRTEMENSNITVVSTDAKKQLSAECLAYIEKHYQENIAVADIAGKLGVSISYLSRNFKECTGETVIQTINQKKLKKAEEYLLTTDYKVYEIAEMLGFENISYFSRFFKKYHGVSPKDFKELRMKEV